LTLPDNPLDSIPAQAWIVLTLAIIAWAPANYVWRYLTHERTLRDITLPPEDTSWKSRKFFFRSLAVVAGLVGVGIFVFTPQAEEFAKSQWFVPSLLGAFGCYFVSTLIPGWRNRAIQPLVRGVSDWALLAWNGVFGAAMLFTSIIISRDNLNSPCVDPDTADETTLRQALATCDAMAAKADLGGQERQDIFAARGRIFDRLGWEGDAVAAYTAALSLDPRDSYSLYNRGAIRLSAGQYAEALGDFDASLALRPDNPDAYRDRGIAHAYLGNLDAAARDFSRLGPPSSSMMSAFSTLAEDAIVKKEYALAVKFATYALKQNPRDRQALRLRAEAYWKLGNADLSQADDDAVRRLEGFLP
jgi:Tfp pilus assembly protein PilF